MANEKRYEKNKEMSLEEARAYRASLYKEEPVELTEQEKREQFRIYWAENKYKFGKASNLEEILWVHLKSTKMNDPKSFEQGIAHFGLKKIK